MKNKKFIALFVVILLFSSFLPLQAYAYFEDAFVTEIPNTERTYDSYHPGFMSLTGYAYGNIQDRTDYIGTDYYRTVSNELEFIEALDGATKGTVKVIEITEDLYLGYKELPDEAKKYGFVSAYIDPININVVTPKITNPTIQKSGVSKIDVSNVNGLTIFSQKGNTIKHATMKLQGSSSDIVIRNIAFDDMWQWEDDPEANNKEIGWAFLKINGANNVWIDHCSFSVAADGNVDIENGSSGISITWCTFGLEADETPSHKSPIYQTITYMEELYQAGKVDSTGRYAMMRNDGATPEEIMAYCDYHAKCHLVGSGDKDYKDNEITGTLDGNQRLRVTLGYNTYHNIGARIPRMRQGSAHLVNCYVDNSTHWYYAGLSQLRHGNQDNCGFIQGYLGACVAADTCELDTVDYPIYGSEYSLPWGVYNHFLIVNSRIKAKNGDVYMGSSWDNNGVNGFEDDNGWYDKSTIGHWAWSSSIVGVENMKRAEFPDYKLDFNYGYDEKLPYPYYAVEIDDVKPITTQYAGAYQYDLPASEWLKINYSKNESISHTASDILVDSLKLTKDDFNLPIGEQEQLNVRVYPSNASDREVTWTSSDSSIISVTDSGRVKAVGEGTALITAKSKSGKTVAVNVGGLIGIESFRLSKKSMSMDAGTSIQLETVVKPGNATLTGGTWKTSNDEIARVDENGLVTAISPGKVTITCVSDENVQFTGTCVITINEGSGILPTETPNPSITPPVDIYEEGDVNQDKIVNASDALLILKSAAKLIELDEVKLSLADMDKNGFVEAADALLVLKKAAGL